MWDVHHGEERKRREKRSDQWLSAMEWSCDHEPFHVHAISDSNKSLPRSAFLCRRLVLDCPHKLKEIDRLAAKELRFVGMTVKSSASAYTHILDQSFIVSFFLFLCSGPINVSVRKALACGSRTCSWSNIDWANNIKIIKRETRPSLCLWPSSPCPPLSFYYFFLLYLAISKFLILLFVCELMARY